MPIMDVIFGTFKDPDEKPEEYGIPEDISHNYFRQILDPLLPSTWAMRLALFGVCLTVVYFN